MFIVSAAMDTVTEADLGLLLPELRFRVLFIKYAYSRTRAQVNRVKRSENGMIVDPVTLS